MGWLKYMWENQRSDLASIVNYLTMGVLIVVIMIALIEVR